MTDDIYRDLTADEELAIVLYMDCNDRSMLDGLANKGGMSEDMKSFIDNLNNGTVKRAARKKPTTDLRALDIYNEIVRLMTGSSRLPLKSNDQTAGAAELAGKKYHVGEDAAIKAYKKVNKAIKDGLNELFSEL